jgi:hypothetical protein
LELILEEVKILNLLIETLQKTNKPQVNVDASVGLLNNIQNLCAKWWEISREFFNLHLLYAQNESELEISGLIWRS